MSSQISVYPGDGGHGLSENHLGDVCVTVRSTPINVDLSGVFERPDAILKWCDQESGLKLMGFGCFAISTASTASENPLEFLIDGVRVAAKDLFTLIKTKLDESLWTIPIGFFALRFDAERKSTAGPWGDWPAALVQIPKRIIVDRNGEETLDIEFELTNKHKHRASVKTGEETATPESTDGRVPLERSNNWDWSEDSCDFQSRVSAVERACRRELVDKIVVARSASMRCDKTQTFCPSQTFDALVNEHPQTIVFALRQGDRHFMGATPETLVKVTESEITTHALAGTATHDPESMLSDDKIRREHGHVVDDIKSRLKPLCEQLQIESKPTIRPANQMFHLQTKLFGVPKEGYSIFDFVRVLHPTPALCGLPRQDSMTWLRETEPLDRGFFGGPVGLFDASGHGGICAVAIRSGLLGPDRAIGFAGAGIVRGSNPGDEWTETEAKLSAFRSALRTVERLDSKDVGP